MTSDSQPAPNPDSDGSGPEGMDGAPARILVVDDEDALRRLLREYLESNGFQVEEAPDGADALTIARGRIFDAIILDLMLPDMSGHEVVDEMRNEGVTTPILMLTGHREDDLVVKALEAGCDDFLGKPVQMAELQARIKALVRRSGLPQPVSAGPIRLDPLRHRAGIGDKEVRLTKVEFLILVTLVDARGDFVSREDLLRDVWQMDFDPGTNLVYTHVANLRQKLSDAGLTDLLETVRGKGYRAVLD